MGKKEDRAKLIEDSASIENFNELAGELEEFLKDRINTLGKVTGGMHYGSEQLGHGIILFSIIAGVSGWMSV